MGKPKAALRYRRQKHVDKITVFVDSDFAGDPVSRMSTTGLVAQIGNHSVKSGSTLQSLTALSVGEVEFYAVVKGGQLGLSLRSFFIKTLEFQWRMKYKVSERSTLTRGTSGHKNEFKMETSVSRKCLRRRTAQMLERSQSLLQYHNYIATLQVCRVGFLLTMDPTLHYKMKADEASDGSGEGSQPRQIRTETRCEHRDPERRTSIEQGSCRR